MGREDLPETEHEGPLIEVLSREECEQLLAPGGVGRVALVEDRGPVAFPVNFAMFEGDVVFRTARQSVASAVLWRGIGFEVDRIDEAMHEGWSVLVTGRARRIDDPDELDRARALGVDPWAGGERDVYFRLTPEEVTGRRLRSG